MKVVFKRGKGARFSQPYTVPTVCPQVWRVLVNDYLRDMSLSACLFPRGTGMYAPKVCLALRTIDPTFTARALRRGALQAMAKRGVPQDTLILFSGHKRVDTLMRYLDWGESADDRGRQARAAALHLVA